MKAPFLKGLSLVFLFSCGDGKTEADRLAEENRKETHEVSPPLPKMVHNVVSIERHFSSPMHKDRFTLSLHGENYSDASLDFTILNTNSDTLFFRKTKGKTLLAGAEQHILDNEEKQMELIRQKMSTFFAETSFSNPPYSLNDPSKKKLSGDTELWDEIRNDTSRWCFEFTLHEEGIMELISYSQKRGTILVYDSSK